MFEMIIENLRLTLKIILFVSVFMTIIDYLELRYKEKINELITGNKINQYILASFLGSIPGCIDAFLVVSLYLHGIVGFGALVTVMLSTAGDEAFVMLAMAPDAAYKIFAILVPLGIIGGYLADSIIEKFDIKQKKVSTEILDSENTQDYLREHVYEHIIKKHIPRLFFWIFISINIIEVLIQQYDLSTIVSKMPTSYLLLVAALIGIIPESGPHMVFLVLYSKGLVPFSVLLVSTLSQDGHGLLPLLSHSVKETAYVQLFTTTFSLIVGILVMFILKI